VPPASFITATGLVLVLMGAAAAVAWWRGRLDHRAAAGLLAVAALVLTAGAVIDPVGEQLDPFVEAVAVPDVHGADAASGIAALEAAGLSTRRVNTCWGEIEPGAITDVRLLERRLWVSMPRIIVDETGVTDDARRLWQGAEVVVGVRAAC
jgi:hypothetical protein